VVEVGTVRRHIGLPTSMVSLVPAKARLDEHMLVVEMRNPS
jgi:arsenite/tail-anchored protein-transporting ATPase